jgi:hypothetical protein
MGDPEHNRKLREIREKARETRRPVPIELWGIWEKYRKKKNASHAYGERGGAEPEQEYVEDEDGGMLRLPARIFSPHEFRRGPDFPGAVSMTDAAKAGREIDDMFTQFKRANRLRSKEDMERIESL